jgi:hypothetical protein
MIPTTTDETGKPPATVVWFDPSRPRNTQPRTVGRGAGDPVARFAHRFAQLTTAQQALVSAVMDLYLE